MVVPLILPRRDAELSRVLAAARPHAAVGDSGSGLPPGLVVFRPPDRSSGPNGPGACAGTLACAASPACASRWAGSGGIFLCTSGTTGTPKGILLREDPAVAGPRCTALACYYGLEPADRGYCCLPLFHVNAEVVGLLATLAARACLVLDGKFSRRGFWALVTERRITWINAVPAIITVLAMDPPATQRPVDGSASSVRPPPRCRRRH